ncbi:sulfatase-like hydrolase/transferase [Nocardioides sp. B-3]|nr:sulfatase-like hydrolase/transferase [Nocardioides sp. B-3]UUZ61282.1 sulfatase-like hydrolase/transferase [Nocardioides sp. B-3]
MATETTTPGGPRGRADQPETRLRVAAVNAEPKAARQMATRPNIVLVPVDDFSMDLVQTMRSVRAMRRRGADYSHAFVVDSLCCVSRSSLFTGQFPHQTGVRTNTSGTASGMPLGGWPAFETHGNPERAFNVALQSAGYTTGFVGKYLNEYEWVPGRALPPAPPGWSELNVVFGSGYDGWDFGSSYLANGRLQAGQHDAPPFSAPMAVRDRAYAGSVIERYAMSFIKRHRGATAPYFLEVAAYAPHNRTQPQPYYPGDPVFPPMFRDRPHDGKPGNCGRVACTDLTTRRLPGFGDNRPDNHPLNAKGKKTKHWNTRANPFPRGRQRQRPAQPRDDGAVDRPHRPQDPAHRGRQHLCRVHLRQRLPPRPERPRSRQGHRLRHRRARAAARRRAGRREGHAGRAHLQHRPRADLRGDRRRRPAALPLRCLAGADVRRPGAGPSQLRLLRAHRPGADEGRSRLRAER